MSSDADVLARFLAKVEARTAVVGVVGLGYVGLPLALRFAEVGFPVLGLDVDAAKIEKLRHGHSYIEHIAAARVAAALRAGLRASTDFGEAAAADALIICVPTPLNRHREPDLSFVVGTVESLLPQLRPGQLLSLESTTYPGTTDEELLTRVERAGFSVGRDFFVAYSPEREDPANPSFTTKTIPKVCGGATRRCLEAASALYGAIIDRIVPVSSTRVAEMSKLLENIHRAVNIGLVNEMKIVADRMGIDIYEVIDAAATKPFGFVPYRPGPGLGGHCIPIDPFYLTWKAREFGVHTRFVELAGEINSSMPEWVVGKVVQALNERRKPLNGSRLLILGVAYKKNVDDMRESPALEIMEKLRQQGAQIAYSDPHVPTFPKLRDHRFELSSVEITPANLAAYDGAVVVTDHDRFDWSTIREHASLIVDTRGVYRAPHPNVVRA
jgi:UDP-N-acetyl-D-glucosamine dehydrogenase